jgi:HEAT repeat protein
VVPLVGLLPASDEDMRQAVELSLEEIGDRRAILLLIDAWRSGGTMYGDLSAFGTAAIDPPLTALKDPNQAVRQGAAEALVHFPQPRVLSALETAWKDPDSEVLQMAPLSLSAHANPQIEALNGESVSNAEIRESNTSLP